MQATADAHDAAEALVSVCIHNARMEYVDIALRTLKHVELLQADQAQQNPEVECIIFV